MIRSGETRIEQLQELIDCGLVLDQLENSYLVCQFADLDGRLITAQVEVLSSLVKIVPADNCETWDLPHIKLKEN